jgi:predicted metal-dependent HD superfamily phosphohydrolase
MTARETVERRWRALAVRRRWPEPAATAVLDELAEAYSQPHRHYHTLDHIAALLALFDNHGTALADPDEAYIVTLAILFHDIVYDPARTDNEAASASLATERLATLGLPAETAAEVARYIHATRHGHEAEPPVTEGLALLLDLDLSILAAEPAQYRAYAEAIRREYAFVPDLLYRPGRRRVLEGFLARDRIYRTDRLAALWEQPARNNLTAELRGQS